MNKDGRTAMSDGVLPIPFGYTERWQGPDAYQVRQATFQNDSIIRLGLIGLGGIAQGKHIPALKRLQTIGEAVELVSGADIDQKTGERAAHYNNFQWYSDYREMLDVKDLDGVLVLTRPIPTRTEIISECLNRGLPVFTEKPLLDDGVDNLPHTLAEAKRLCELAEEKRVPLMVGFVKRYAPPYANAHHLVTSGAIGKPAMIAAKMCQGWGGDKFLEHSACHALDLIRFYMGDLSSLTAYGVNQYGNASYPFDNATIAMKFRSGAVGSLYVSSSGLSLKPWERIEIYGDQAWLVVDDSTTLTLYDSETGPGKVWQPIWPHTLLFEAEFSGFAWELRAFLDAIRKRQPSISSGWDGYRVIEFCLAIHRSLKTGTEVKLPVPVEGSSR